MGGNVTQVIRRRNGNVIKMITHKGAHNNLFYSKEFNNNEIKKSIEKHVHFYNE